MPEGHRVPSSTPEVLEVTLSSRSLLKAENEFQEAQQWATISDQVSFLEVFVFLP